ncbi:MAG: hypothetical protein AAGJ85_09385, partial [Pseudomonadota bacterium]
MTKSKFFGAAVAIAFAASALPAAAQLTDEEQAELMKAPSYSQEAASVTIPSVEGAFISSA